VRPRWSISRTAPCALNGSYLGMRMKTVTAMVSPTLWSSLHSAREAIHLFLPLCGDMDCVVALLSAMTGQVLHRLPRNIFR